ncbi:(No apical meristem) protein [Musa troglodytarum]|uniref:(No apical meristem) protein n=1 Tax=Musa troglodytarum TaxID=320322 RepID=A0A9E7FIR3_9LILI|nr:(No apical meristem) protein [Musa troglodytarum]
MNPISKFVSTPLQQTSIVLEGPYQVPRMLLQPDKFQVWQSSLQRKLDRHRSTSGLEELIMSCTAAGTAGETSTPLSQETAWQYSYWSPANPDHHG